MKFLRRFIYKRAVKGLEYRLKSLEDLMDMAQKQMESLGQQIQELELEKPEPTASLKKIKDEFETWSRMYWDAYNRHDEVETALMYILKDFNRR